MEELRQTNEKGQTLIEVLVALTAAIVVIYAIATAVISALSNAQFSKSQGIATQYAQEGIEIMRQIRDSDWSRFYSYKQTDSTIYYCLNKNAKDVTENGSACSPNVDSFIREVQIQKNSSDCTQPLQITNAAKVTVIVYWSDGKCTNTNNLYCHNVRLSSCFSDFQVVATPGENPTPTP